MTNKVMQSVQAQVAGKWPTGGARAGLSTFEALLLPATPTSSTGTCGVIL